MSRERTPGKQKPKGMNKREKPPVDQTGGLRGGMYLF
jgi:hypothetical protein